ncbi:uncharacterized protein METZ01_LOCUS385184, partial [marine metagenome]
PHRLLGYAIGHSRHSIQLDLVGPRFGLPLRWHQYRRLLFRRSRALSLRQRRRPDSVPRRAALGKLGLYRHRRRHYGAVDDGPPTPLLVALPPLGFSDQRRLRHHVLQRLSRLAVQKPRPALRRTDALPAHPPFLYGVNPRAVRHRRHLVRYRPLRRRQRQYRDELV